MRRSTASPRPARSSAAGSRTTGRWRPRRSWRWAAPTRSRRGRTGTRRGFVERPEARNPIDASELARGARRHRACRRLDRVLRARGAGAAVARTARDVGRAASAGHHGRRHARHAAHGARRAIARRAARTPQRLHEFAEGLGYWAARYQELPSARGRGRNDARRRRARARAARRSGAAEVRHDLRRRARCVDAETFAPGAQLRRHGRRRRSVRLRRDAHVRAALPGERADGRRSASSTR